MTGDTRTAAGLDAAVAAMVTEATRVIDARAAAAAAGNTLPHVDRAAGCEAWLALNDAQRRRLVGRAEIVAGSFRIDDVQQQMEYRLQRAGSVRAAIRRSVAERIIERWDRQVALALMGQRTREMRRSELHAMVEDLIREHGTTTLTNDYGARVPEDDEFAAAEGSLLERQIDLVDGGPRRVQRAVRDRWRARNQRRRWTDDDASLVVDLKTYDDLLKEAWGDQHGPMCDDCRGLEDGEHRRHGLAVLDWAHDGAPISVRPPRPGWSDGFYVRGMLQQFADELEVGWHPDYLAKLGAASAVEIPTAATTGPPPAATAPTAMSPTDPVPPAPAATLARISEALRNQLPSDLVPAAATTAADAPDAEPGAGTTRRTARPRRARPANPAPANTE